MTRARAKQSAPTTPPPLEVPGDHRILLTGAYQAGLILAWKRDLERGYRLTLAGPQDEYVDLAHLSRYIDTLRTARAKATA